MPLTREERKLLHQKSKQPTFGVGKPDKSEGYDGDISFRKVEGSGTVEYVKEDGDWTAVASSGEMPAVRIVGSSGGGGGGSGITVHGALSGLGSDDHEQYILADGSRALTANWDAGSYDIRAATVTPDGLTAGRVVFAGTNGVLSDDSDLTFSTATLTATNIGAYTLTGKLTAGSTEIEGSAFDINGGDVSAITISGGLTWSSAQDLNSQVLTNVNIDSGDISAATISGGLTWSAAQDLNNQNLTNVDINSGDIGAVTISGDNTWSSDQTGVSSLTLADGKSVNLTTGNVTLTTGNIIFTPSTDDTVTIDAAANGVLNITTVDDAGANANINITSDGAFNVQALGSSSLDFSGALTIDCVDDSMLIDGHTGVEVKSSATGKVTIDGKAGVDIQENGTPIIGIDTNMNVDIDSVALDIDASGAITIDGTSTVSIDGADDMNFTITSSTGGEDLTIQQIGGNDSSIFILAAGTGSDAIKIDATAGSMEIGVSLADQKTLTLGNTGSTYLQLIPHGTAGSEKILIKNTAGSADDALKLWSAAGGITLLAASNSLNIDADGTDSDALNIDSAGGIDIDAADMIDIDAADEITIDTTSADGHIAITSLHTAGQSILISANADAGSILDIDAGIIDIDVQDTINIDAADEIEIATTSADGHISLVSAHTAGLAFHIDANSHASSEVQIDAGILDVDVTGAATIDAGAASNLTTSAGNLTVDSAAGVLVLDGHTGITLDASNSGNIEINVTAADDILIGNDAVAQDVLIGNAAATQVDLTAILVDINGGSSGVTIDGGAASNFTTSAGALTLASAATATWTCGGNLTLDVTGNIILDAASNIIYFKDNGTHALTFENDEHGEWTIENQTAGQQIDISSPNGITLDGYNLSCNQNYELHIGSSGVNNFYTHGDADLKKNYSMLAVQYTTPATSTGSDIWSAGASYYNS